MNNMNKPHLILHHLHEAIKGRQLRGPDNLRPGLVTQPSRGRVRVRVIQCHAPCQQEPPLLVIHLTSGGVLEFLNNIFLLMQNSNFKGYNTFTVFQCLTTIMSSTVIKIIFKIIWLKRSSLGYLSSGFTSYIGLTF